MENNSKKYVSLNSLSNFLDNLSSKFASLSHKHALSDLTDYTPITVDNALSSTSTNPVQNKVLDAEFDAISDAMGALEQAIDGFVRYTEQSLTDEQKAQARINIGFTEENALIIATEIGLIEPVTDEAGVIYTDENNIIYTL
jgi:hypothetical protein